ncbi:MAG: hypothetical protein FWB78_12455 [Treponema sp.]|nr:hypothetical protein [Treponema sp.]
MKNNESENSTPRKKIGLLYIVVPSLVIIGLIAASFLLSEERFQITASIVVLVCVLVCVILSKFFDTISVGKIISLSNTVGEYKERNRTLETRNHQLTLQAFRITNSQQMSSVFAPGAVFSFVEASDKEIMKHKLELPKGSQRKDRNKIEGQVLEKYFKGQTGKMLRNVKVTSLQSIDPISDRLTIFDAYHNEDGEKFIEITWDASHSSFYDRLYVQLNKIYHYRKAKNPEAFLLLLIADISSEKNANGANKLKEHFLPAINTGLLRIDGVDLPQ